MTEQERLRLQQLAPWKEEAIRDMLAAGIPPSDAHLAVDLAIHADAEAQRAIARVLDTAPQVMRHSIALLASGLTGQAMLTLQRQIKEHYE